MSKTLFKDSVLYGALGAVQKLAPFLILPLVTRLLGQEALKVYDVAFAYVLLFSWLIILGQDAAASVLYFDEKKNNFDKRQVTTYAFLLQLLSLLFFGSLLLLFSSSWSRLLFSGNADIAAWWRVALAVLPGQMALNYTLNLLLWRRRRAAYAALCFVQATLSILGSYLSLLVFKVGITGLFYSLIGSISLTALIGLTLVRKQLFAPLFPLNRKLVKTLLVLGLPFALTAFFTQLLPAADRFFLLRYGYANALAPYVLASKLGSLANLATGAFILAFTPYSLAKLNEERAEQELSNLFRFVSASAFVLVPFALLFKDLLLAFFADASYRTATKLLPFFFFGWLFDLFTYFTLLGIYRSHKSWLSLVLFAGGFVVLALLNLVLVPLYGLYGAALSFCLGKAAVFFLSWGLLKRYFHLRLYPKPFWGSLVLAALCSYLVYLLPFLFSALLVAALLCVAFVFLHGGAQFSSLHKKLFDPLRRASKS